MRHFDPKNSFIFGKNIQAAIKEELKVLEKNGCTYLSYIVKSSDNKTYRFCSDEDWLYKAYLEGDLVAHCPLRKVAFSNIGKIFTWEMLTMNRREFEVLSARREFRQYNGITLVNNLNPYPYKEIIAMATADEKLQLAKTVIIEPDRFSKSLLRIRKFALDSLVPKSIIHL